MAKDSPTKTKPPASTERERQYTEQLGVKISPDMLSELLELAAQTRVPKTTLARLALELGLPLVRKRYASALKP